MTVKFTIDKAGLRKLEREMAKNIKKAAQRRLPAGTKIADGDADKIAKTVTKEIESAFKGLSK